jgi:hypothetical protein
METACDITGRHIGAIAPGELRQTAADLVLQTAILRESLTEANVTRTGFAIPPCLRNVNS